ncbi:2-phospho-L-lactate guanylyltransferase [Couchioplanes azureus]|uniref:2-phospho-L-lactate guanylyltransferase n=1 Tax=Couchioplanes caeruleus TaxID=56438 RepID=UPI0019B9365A|nr:2-phospho-L-lactate guanylyltransferase [Couchioplanes caeruleus]GGQ38016.1 2-phospho-L-lactate guanylyltransferase [Couchioplanes caeruleus subsp. azureus]
MSAPDWTAVVPVKRLSAAKSRLRGAVPAAWHERLALAMVRDTVTAIAACEQVGEVVVVTDDPVAAAAVAALGARVVGDVGGGLNAALRHGAEVAVGPGRRRAALAGDLPALRPDELGAALLAAGDARGFVVDAAGSGTVLLTAGRGTALDPRFGAGSAAAHAASGAVALGGEWPGLRQDVDTAADLRTVLELGAGDHTCALLRGLGLAGCGSYRVPAGPPR